MQIYFRRDHYTSAKIIINGYYRNFDLALHEKVNSFTSTTMQKNNISVFHGQILKDQVLLNFLAFNVSIALP